MTAEKLQWVRSEVLASLYNRSGLAGEQYRKMRIRLEGLKETLGGAMQLIVVTSPMMGEGKTATAANLAVSLAQEEGRKVILVDCDIRKPRLWSLFRRPPDRGLADVLAGGAHVADVVRATEDVPLDVLPIPRNSDDRIDPMPVDRLKGLFRDLRERYDFIICDAPPVLPIADTAALARLSDGVVLVVRAGATPRHAVTRTLESLDRNKLVGFVLNAVSERAIDRYYYQYHVEGRDGHRAVNGDRK